MNMRHIYMLGNLALQSVFKDKSRNKSNSRCVVSYNFVFISPSFF